MLHKKNTASPINKNTSKRFCNRKVDFKDFNYSSVIPK